MGPPHDNPPPTTLASVKPLLCTRWAALSHNPAVFRYTLNVLAQQILPGQFGFIAQLNTDRTTKRRPPQAIASVTPPFNPAEFNFNRIDPLEILVEMPFAGVDFTFIVNSSPLTANHTLICPQRSAELPQILTAPAVQFAVQLLAAFGDRSFRIGYNSPGAWASVNHLHLHLVQLPERLYVERVPLQRVGGTALYRIGGGDAEDSRPVDGFAFCVSAKVAMMDDERGGIWCEDVMRLVRFLCGRQIPHNVLWTLADAAEADDDVDDTGPTVRIFVFPKAHTSTAKEFSSFNIAFCELSGYVPISNASVYATVTEAEIVAKMRQDVGDVCAQIVDEVAALYDR